MKEAKVIYGMGSLTLVVKGKTVADDGFNLDHSEYDLSNEDYALMVSNPKRFARKKFPSSKNRNWQGSYRSEKVKEENKSGSQKEEDKKEKILVGDFGYDENYCHGKNHLAKECML